MTAQIDDIFKYNGVDYAVAGISDGELFNPSLLGLKPFSNCTACWRGYQAVFTLDHDMLILDTLNVNLLDRGDSYKAIGPVINGIEPSGAKGEKDWFKLHYSGLKYRLSYSGGLLLADGFIDDLYVHMGFHPAWKYARVVELIFENGILRNEFDRSARIAEVRQKILDSHSDSSLSQKMSIDDIFAFVERSFDRTYKI